jgi:hypothetical protein
MLLEVEQDCSTFKYHEVVVAVIDKNWDAAIWIHLDKPWRLTGYSNPIRYFNSGFETLHSAPH